MASDNDSEVRINILVDRERNNRLKHLLPWGNKSTVIRNVVEHLIDDLENDEDGSFYSALMKDNVKLTIIKT